MDAPALRLSQPATSLSGLKLDDDDEAQTTVTPGGAYQDTPMTPLSQTDSNAVTTMATGPEDPAG